MDQRAIDPGRIGGALDGLVSYYSLHDQPRADLATRSPRGRARYGRAAAARRGEGGLSDGVIDDPLGSGIRVYWAEFTEAELVAAAQAAGFLIDDIAARDAYDDEIQTRRLFIAATRVAESR